MFILKNPFYENTCFYLIFTFCALVVSYALCIHYWYFEIGVTLPETKFNPEIMKHVHNHYITSLLYVYTKNYCSMPLLPHAWNHVRSTIKNVHIMYISFLGTWLVDL